MSRPSRPRGRPRLEENALSEDELDRRAKRQKRVRDSEEVAAEKDLQGLLAKVKPGSCETATVEELKTMIESSALIVKKVAGSSKNLKGTFVKSLKDAASVSAVAARALARRMDPRPNVDEHIRKQLEDCQAVCLIYKAEMEELRGFKARYEELASKVSGHICACSCSNSGTSADPTADIDLLVDKLAARFQEMGYFATKAVQEERTATTEDAGAKTPQEKSGKKKTPKEASRANKSSGEASREKRSTKEESKGKKPLKEKSRAKKPSKEDAPTKESRVAGKSNTKSKKRTSTTSSPKPGKATPTVHSAPQQTSTTPWTEVVKRGKKTTQKVTSDKKVTTAGKAEKPAGSKKPESRHATIKLATAEGAVSYRDALMTVQRSIDLKSMGLNAVGLRRSTLGEVVIRVSGAGKEEKAKKLAEAINANGGGSLKARPGGLRNTASRTPAR
ncbi:hypothetical protein RUM44_002382 [Polyplax serrata]|uniref:Uncharacterized protein n=1 Tax=Polyplax serrata TaxID=468196 RepID=A0ABR1AD66_POLSC